MEKWKNNTIISNSSIVKIIACSNSNCEQSFRKWESCCLFVSVDAEFFRPCEECGLYRRAGKMRKRVDVFAVANGKGAYYLQIVPVFYAF